MNPIYDFKGKVALVTGAAKGMGLATARMFAESGASVVLADLDGDLAAKEAERIVLGAEHQDLAYAASLTETVLAGDHELEIGRAEDSLE